ncbi:MAG: hypothetical protein NC320_02140 [Clostridium sp.]|nr:hypothetical protein [Clostridium sp.]
MYITVKSDDDISKLMEEFGGFHDSCIVSVNYESGNFVDSDHAMGSGDLLEHKVTMILHSQFCPPIEMIFEGVRKCSIVGWRDNHFCNIYGADLEFRNDMLGKTKDDNLIVWASIEEFTKDETVDTTYIIAETLKWRFFE